MLWFDRDPQLAKPAVELAPRFQGVFFWPRGNLFGRQDVTHQGQNDLCFPYMSAIDLPLGHKDEAWSFDHFDTMTVMVADAPRPDEIVLCIAVSDGCPS